MLLVGNSRRTYVELMRRIRSAALLVGGGGILLAILLSSWAAARVTRPVEQLARAAQEVAAGNWDVRVDVWADDELAQFADSFNRMTAELLAQKERLVQAERVAAWRELARRLAHELKNPLFPLQLTVENLVRARQQSPEQFDEVFQESSSTLLAEISNLKTIIGRFSEFSKMPQPQLQPVQVNDIVRGVLQLCQAQTAGAGACGDRIVSWNWTRAGTIAADPDLLHRALSNLVLNAMDAMPSGGTLTLRSTRDENGKVMIEVADTGIGNDAGGVRANLYSLLHEQAAWHRAGAGDRAVGGQRSWRKNQRAERAGTRDDICDRVAGASDAVHEAGVTSRTLRFTNGKLRGGRLAD